MDENKNRLRQLGIFMTIPFVLAVPPILGWAIGSWLDKKLDSSPYLMYILVVLGFISGFRELYRIVRKYGDDI